MLGDVRDGSARTCLGEALDVLVHGGPKVSLADAMKCAISVQVPAYGVCVESHEDDVSHGIRDDAKIHVLVVVGKDFPHVEDAVCDVEQASTGRVAIDVGKGVYLFLVVRYARVGDDVQEELGLGVISQRLGPGLVVRESGSDGAIDKSRDLGNRRGGTSTLRVM
jgi:hypothetical protein